MNGGSWWKGRGEQETYNKLESNNHSEEFNVEREVGSIGEGNTNKTSLFLACTTGYTGFFTEMVIKFNT